MNDRITAFYTNIIQSIKDKQKSAVQDTIKIFLIDKNRKPEPVMVRIKPHDLAYTQLQDNILQDIPLNIDTRPSKYKIIEPLLKKKSLVSPHDQELDIELQQFKYEIEEKYSKSIENNNFHYPHITSDNDIEDTINDILSVVPATIYYLKAPLKHQIVKSQSPMHLSIASSREETSNFNTSLSSRYKVKEAINSSRLLRNLRPYASKLNICKTQNMSSLFKTINNKTTKSTESTALKSRNQIYLRSNATQSAKHFKKITSSRLETDSFNAKVSFTKINTIPMTDTAIHLRAFKTKPRTSGKAKSMIKKVYDAYGTENTTFNNTLKDTSYSK